MLEWTGERYLPFIDPGVCGAEIHYEHLHRYAFAAQFVSGKKVLDLASGEGYGSYLLAKEANFVVGVDIDENAVKHASQKYQAENLNFVKGSICEIPIKGEKEFDVIISFEAIEHIEEQEAFLSEVKRLLKDDGLFIVSSPNKTLYTDETGQQNPHHVKELYFHEFENLLRKYFSNTIFFGQEVCCGSNIWELKQKGISKSLDFVIEKKNTNFDFVDEDSKDPLYYIAVASNCRTEKVEDISSYLVDKSHTLLKQGLTYIRELEEGMHKRENLISGYEGKISDYEEKTSDYEEKISHYKGKISIYEEKISDYEEKINSLNSQISDLNKRSQELEHEIDEMKQSILYKIAMGFQTKFVERALPVNTRRRRTYDTCLLTGRTLINQGPSNLLTSQKKDQMQKKDASESSDREKIQDLRPDQTGINIDLYNNMKKSRLHELTAKYVRGKGIQVGPVYHELGITSNIDITYLNHTGQEQISQEQPEPENSVPAKPDKVIDIGCLDKYENEELNFCIVNKVTEKVKDPLEFLNCALRTLKPGGILFLIDSNNADSPETSDEKEEKTLSKEYPTEAILKQLNLQEPDLFTVLEDVEYNFEHEKKEAQEHVFIVEKGHFEKEITRLLKTSDGIINSKDIELDVIVPVYNAYEDTLKCLYSVLKNAGNFRTVLINDKSTDHRIKDLFTKLKPFESEKFVLLENPENKGFVKTVNRGMKFSEKDVILLNSDTIVTEGWTRKLKRCAYSDEKIGTVTPFTNNGTICSIPNFCENNEIPAGFTIEAFANFIEQISLKKYPEIPTAVGFCMYIKREALDKAGYFNEEAFGKGYGEENDFCMRVIRKGYKNVLCDDTFVFHKGEASFSASKAELIKKNLDTLSKMYPDYIPAVSKFINSNPLKEIHENIQLRIQTWDIQKKKIMYILHSWGGGTENHVKNLIKKFSKDYKLYVLQVISNKIILTEINNNNVLKYIFSMNSQMNRFEFHNEEYEKIISSIIDTFQINLIHVHQLIGHTFDVFNIAKIRNIPIVFSIHDFYSVCPKINLIDYNNKYCHGKNNSTDCRICFMDFGITSFSITSWRNNFTDIFEQTTLIIAPSKSTLEILSTYYPNIAGKSIVIEHGHEEELLISRDVAKKPRDMRNKPFHIAFIGGLSPGKGRKIFYDLAGSKELRDKTRWSIFGISDIHSDPACYQDLNVTIFGKYRNFLELKKMILENEVDLVIFPAKWAETFSYTLSEAWSIGVPVLVSDLGALKDRVEKNGGGWVVDISETKNVENKILEIISKPEEYIAKTNEVQQISLKDLDSMIFEYDTVYKTYLKSITPIYFSQNVFTNNDLLKNIFSENLHTPSETSNIEAEYSANLPRRLVQCYYDNGFIYTVNKTKAYVCEAFSRK
ncbi:methyltransferase domain-containing protein [Methanosarcina mazei]|uniref:Glycosyltransferase n=1 Tax=Methanosarcina mazei LYC TaxID=1434114 RepID=A0A0E3RR04_METMZ|nr:methyltransferase domain-containing protein [Methanosarcina mazei]AKB69181.1 hypothetical protein MSMAL_2638 [Methanosarcina mazei LYC]